MVILERLKNVWDKENECPESCTCDCCYADDVKKEEKFEVRENLTDEEIEEIINSEYKDRAKTDKNNIKRALKRFGNRYSYHKTEFRYRRGEQTSRATEKLITVTCIEHGNFTIKRSKFFKMGCPDCFFLERNSKVVDDIFKSFLYKDYQNTRKYLRECYVSGSLNKNFTGIILKEDLITLASDTRNDVYLFDFSAVPDIIEGINIKILIKFNEPNLNISGDWKTNILHFIYRKQLPSELTHIYGGRKRSQVVADITKQKLENKYPKLDFSSFEYKNMKEPIKYRCKVHDLDLSYHSVDGLLRAESECGGCPECLREYRESLDRDPRAKTNEEFIKDCENVYGVGTYDYSLVNYKRWDLPVDIIDPEYNEIFTVQPSYFLQGKGSTIRHESYGETLVRRSLEKIKEDYINSMIIKKEKSIINKIEGRNIKLVKIDFVCYIESREIWIEYNGPQHYSSDFYKSIRKLSDWKSEYEKQLKRDNNVREYCEENDILLIEIPYTYNKKDSVYDILYSILVNNTCPKDVIVSLNIEEI